jgi:phospholipid/cholesterol/gamma-HCH transport system substrate-binding protein
LAKITDLADKLTTLVDDKNRASLAATLDNLSRVTAAAAAHSDDLEQLLANGASDSKELHRAILSMQDTMRTMQDTMHHFDGVAVQATNAMRDADALVKENREPLKEFTQNGLDEMRQLVGQTQNLVTALTRTVNTLERDPSRLIYGDRREGYRPQ